MLQDVLFVMRQTRAWCEIHPSLSLSMSKRVLPQGSQLLPSGARVKLKGSAGTDGQQTENQPLVGGFSESVCSPWAFGADLKKIVAATSDTQGEDLGLC